jgi:hypothetical protein
MPGAASIWLVGFAEGKSVVSRSMPDVPGTVDGQAPPPSAPHHMGSTPRQYPIKGVRSRRR